MLLNLLVVGFLSHSSHVVCSRRFPPVQETIMELNIDIILTSVQNTEVLCKDTPSKPGQCLYQRHLACTTSSRDKIVCGGGSNGVGTVLKGRDSRA